MSTASEVLAGPEKPSGMLKQQLQFAAKHVTNLIRRRSVAAELVYQSTTDLLFSNPLMNSNTDTNNNNNNNHQLQLSSSLNMDQNIVVDKGRSDGVTSPAPSLSASMEHHRMTEKELRALVRGEFIM